MHDPVPGTNALRSFPFACTCFYLDESGQDLIEYALLAALVACASVAGTQNLASAVADKFTGIQAALSNAIPPGTPNAGTGGGTTGGGGRGGGRGGARGGGGRGSRRGG